MHFINKLFDLHYIVIFLLSPYFYESNARFNSFLSTQDVISKTITVDKNGQGDFTSLQKAIDSVPLNSKVWTHIHVKAGTYKEKINIPQYKYMIALSGESKETTIFEWDEVSTGPDSATAVFSGDDFVAANISFKAAKAPALTVNADKASFYNVGLYGMQDTLTDGHNRHYFHSCYIEGVVDFIWGRGQSIYEDCTLHATQGYITAQGRDSETDPGGFVFLRGTIVGNGPTLLGRAYRSHARVVFKETDMTINIKPEGWDIWRQKGHESTVTYAEVNCTGIGASMGGRVKWEKTLSAEELHALTDIDTFINQDKWIQQQPKLI